MGVIYKLYLIIDTIIFVALFVFFFLLDVIYVNLTPQEMQQFKVVYLIASTFAVFNFPFVTQNGILTAYEKFIPLKLADIIYRILLVSFTIVALLLGYGLYALVSVHAIVGILVVIFKFIIIRKDVPMRANWKHSDSALYKEIFAFSIWVTIASLAQRLIFNITPTVLGVTSGTEAIAVFGIVTTIEGYAYTITTAINGMFMPKISKEYAMEGEDEQHAAERLNALFINVGRFQYVLNGLIVVGFAVLGRSFIALWMGNGFDQAYAGILLVIIPGLFFNSLQIANTAMIVRKKVKLQAIINIITGCTNIVLSFILSYYIGVLGSCISIFVAYMLRAIILNVVTRKVLKFDIKEFIKKCYVRTAIPIAISLVIAFGINYFIPDGGWLIFLCEAAIVVVIYIVTIFFIGITKDERRSCVTLFKKKILRR